MLRATAALFAGTSRLTGYSPYRQRPGRMNRAAADGHFINVRYGRSATRRRDDPTPTMPAGHIKLLRCPHCHRVRHVHRSEASHFWTCCEGVEMVDTRQTLRTAQQKQHELQRLSRQYDFTEMRPRSNMHKPPSKARSKMKK